jgi:ABC-2 type transport system permease protein
MGFIKQIGIEFKNILRVKFLLIFGIIILALPTILAPVLGVIAQKAQENNNGGGGGYYPMTYAVSSYAYKDMYYPGDSGEEPIIIDGVTIESDNPYYWNIQSLQEQGQNPDSSMFTEPGALDLWIGMNDVQLDYYVRLATYITTYQDYRVDLTWDTQPLIEKFIYENTDKADPAALKEAAGWFIGFDDETYNKKYVNITPEDRLEAIDTVDQKMEKLFDVVENDNFSQYIDLRIQQENDNIKNYEDQIEIFEKDIIEHPDQEESLNMQIEDMKKQIQLVKENNIPILEYRLAHNIVPYDYDQWQNSALDDVTNNRQQLQYTTIMTEEQFNQDQWTAVQYGSYASYVSAINAQIAKLNNNIIIAQNSLDAEKPDMKYVPDGARSMTTGFLAFSIAVALFGVMAGGWLMASEFQMGTIRLLMIRPKTRMKILMSKFLAGLVMCLVIYVAGTLINLLLNGIFFGFQDFGFPNFTVTGQVGFFAYFIPKFLACIVPIVFVYCVSFMLSVLVKNIAVAIAVPAVCLVGCILAMFAMYMFSMSFPVMTAIAFTPIPFIQMYAFFVDGSPVSMMMQNGVPVSLAYGIILLLGLSAVCTGISMLVFKKRDITN